jgi:hypothetical protein
MFNVKLAEFQGGEFLNLNLRNFNKIKNDKDLYRRINDFRKGYQPRTNIVKDKKSD